MSWQKSYPPSQGWMRMEATLKEPVTLDELQKMVTFGKPHDYEFGSLSNVGKKAVVILRKLPEAWLIWSRKHSPSGNMLWWRPDGAGYTMHIPDAGRFTKQEALEIAARSSGLDVALPLSEILRLPLVSICDRGWMHNTKKIADLIERLKRENAAESEVAS